MNKRRISVLNDSKNDEAAMQVLLVDDNALQASTREAILVRNGMSVVLADGPQAALEILSEPAGRSRIQLMVTDHLMPGMNGAELSRQVRKLAPGDAHFGVERYARCRDGVCRPGRFVSAEALPPARVHSPRTQPSRAAQPSFRLTTPASTSQQRVVGIRFPAHPGYGERQGI